MKFFILAICLLPSFLHAQSFFKPIPKPTFSYGVVSPNSTEPSATTAPGGVITLNAWRPIVNVVAYAEPGNKLMAGAGPSYQHLVWDEGTGKYYCKYSFSGLMFLGGSVAPKTPSEATSFGAMVGVFNNLINVGVIPPITSPGWQAVISIGISLNN